MKIFGYVQAGGGSTRFGSDKALAEFGGKSLLERTVEIVAGACGDAWVVADQGRYGGLGLPVLADRWPGQGPLGGILTAIYHAKEKLVSEGPADLSDNRARDAALVVSCDMPFLTREWLEYVCERAEHSEAMVVVPESEDGLEPLCACWKLGALAAVQAAFAGGVRKVTEAMKRVPMEVLDEAVWKRFDTDGRLFWNMNTQGDYEEARRVFEERARKNTAI